MSTTTKMIEYMDKYKDIKHLIDCFFDGKTSLEEEQRLYDFFATHQELPKELDIYREMFTDLGAISFHETRITKEMPKKALHKKLLYTLSGIAAAALLFFGITTLINIHEDHMLAQNYAGSYVIENGQRIDDLSRIKPDIEKALGKAKDIETHMQEHSIVKNAEQNILNNVDDSEEKARIQQLLEE